THRARHRAARGAGRRDGSRHAGARGGNGRTRAFRTRGATARRHRSRRERCARAVGGTGPTAAGTVPMRERGLTLLVAAAALLAFYARWLTPAPSLDPAQDTARPTTAGRRGNGYFALHRWLQRAGVGVRSWRERYTALKDLDAPPRGNL